MKKISLFVVLVFSVSLMWGVTIFEEDFESTTAYSPINLTDWTNQSVLGSEQWEGREFSSNSYAQMASYNTGEANEVWLVTPVIDLTIYTNTELTFDVNIGYWTHEGLTIHISTDFTNDVTIASWDDVTSNFTIPTSPSGGYGTFASAGNMDLTSYSGTIYVAFKYVGDDNAGQTTTYQIDNVAVSGTGSTPEVTVSTSTLSGFSYIEGSGPSSEQSFDVAGTNLTANVTVTPPTNYEVSETSGSGFGSTITLTPSSGTLASTTIYVRLKAGLSAGGYNSEDITVASTGASSKTVTCNGSVALANLPNAWINEIHYDNSGTDENEGVEVVIQNPDNYTLANFFITLYNGSDQLADDSHSLDTFTVGTSEGDFTIYYKMISGIQNGSPDGLALGYDTSLIQFLSYEGTFTALDGIANGILSTDIGVSEGTTTTTQSLQLTGSGTQYSDFTWEANLEQTWGTPNDGGDQTLPVTLTSFTGVCFEGLPHINWTTQSETENLGWNVYRSDFETGWDDENVSLCNAEMIPGQGTTSSVTNYTYIDEYDIVEDETYFYWLESISISGNVEIFGPVSVLVEIEEEPNIIPDLPDATMLNSNYPNPFNPTTTIKFDIKEDESGRLTIFNILGQKILDKEFAAGFHTYSWNAAKQASGVYFYTLKTASYYETKKMILMK